MRITVLIVVLLGSAFLLGSFADAQGPCDASEAELAEVKNSMAAIEAAAAACKQEITSLKSGISSAESCKGKLSQAEQDLSTAQSKLAALESELASTQSKLKKAEGKLAKAESDLSTAEKSAKAAAEHGSTCKRSLTKLESTVSEQASRLEQLKAVEEALLPLWLSRRVDSSVAYASAQWQQLQESDVAAQVLAKVGPYWEQALTASKPAREAAAVYVDKAKKALNQLPVAETLASAKQQVSNIERELLAVLQSFIASQPALAGLNDPVTLQLLVYTVLGMPLLLLAVLLVSVYGGPGKSGADVGAGKGKKGSAPAAAAGKKGAAAGKSKTAVQQTPVGKKGGKAVRDGGDVLYTP